MNKRDIPKRTRLEIAEFVIESIRKLDIEPPQSSRLMRMYQTLVDHPETIYPGHKDFEIMVEADCDMQVLSFVFDHLVHQVDQDKLKILMKNVVKDSAFPQDDRDHSKGRDTQFELYIAAVCQCAGMTPVELEEPDVTCFVNGVKYCIAAKRVKNIRNLSKRIKKAAKQVAQSKLPGIVALDTTLALNPNNDRIWAQMSDSQFGSLYRERFGQFVRAYSGKISKWVENKGVCGVLFQDHQVRDDPFDGWGLEGMTYRLHTCPDDPQLEKGFKLFEEQFLKGLPNLEYR